MNYEGKITKMRQTQVQYLRKKKNKKKRIENNRSFCRDEKRHKPLVLSPEYPEKKLKKPDILSWNFITLDIKKKKNSQKCPEEKSGFTTDEKSIKFSSPMIDGKRQGT